MIFNNFEEFENWKKGKLRKEWQPERVQFKCSNCTQVYTITARNLKKDFVCKTCRKAHTESSKNKEVKEKENLKRKSTLLERYGVDSPSKVNKEKAKQTCLERYGVENPMQSEEIQKLRVESILEKYGVESTNQVESIKEKQRVGQVKAWKERKEEIISLKRKTLLERYGEENYNNPGLRKQTCKERYGVENPFQSEEVKEKIKQTCLERYYNECYQQSLIGKEKARRRSELESPQEKALRREKCRQTWREKTPEEMRAIRSKSIHRYSYKDEKFDSSWELALWICAKDLSMSIKREPCVFEYTHGGVKHFCFPDFEFEGHLIEIKGGQFFKEDGTLQNPFDHSLDSLFEAKRQCMLENGVIFWKKEDVQFALDYVQEKYGKDWIQLFE